MNPESMLRKDINPLSANVALIQKPIKCQCCPHIENSQLICFANQLTGFYMRATLALNGLRKPSEKLDLSLKSPRKNWKKKLMKKNLDFIFYNP